MRKCVNPEYFVAGQKMKARLDESGMPLAYEVLFSDGFVGVAMEDELLLSTADYGRPNTPRRT